MPDRRQFAPATQRNREPILQVLQTVLPPTGTVLEIASGTGEHAITFAPHFPALVWQPSDVQPIALASIQAWQTHTPTPNLRAPLKLDVSQPSWWEAMSTEDLPAIAAIVNINMIHISPWSACVGLLEGAANLLAVGGCLYFYGPFKREGQHTATSNAAFDRSLQATDPDWGVRNLEDVIAIAQGHHFRLADAIAMPANNLSVVFQKEVAESPD